MPAIGSLRRGPTWSAIIVPWLKPTSASRFVGKAVAGELGVEEARRASGAGGRGLAQ